MKSKLFLLVACVLATFTTVTAQPMKNRISQYSFTQIKTGAMDSREVNKLGWTGVQLKQVLNAWTSRQTNGVATIDSLILTSNPMVYHWNTRIVNGVIEVYFDKTPKGEVWSYKGYPILKDSCCNLISTGPGSLRDFIANFEFPSTVSPVVNPEDTASTPAVSKGDQNSNTNSKNMDNSTLILIAILALVAIVAIVALGSRMGWWGSNTSHTHNTTHTTTPAQGFYNPYANEVSGLLNAMNTGDEIVRAGMISAQRRLEAAEAFASNWTRNTPTNPQTNP